MTSGRENVAPVDIMTMHSVGDPTIKYTGGPLFGGPTELTDATESARQWGLVNGCTKEDGSAITSEGAKTDYGTYKGGMGSDNSEPKVYKYEYTNGVNGVKCSSNKKVIHFKGMEGGHSGIGDFKYNGKSTSWMEMIMSFFNDAYTNYDGNYVSPPGVTESKGSAGGVAFSLFLGLISLMILMI
jgi:poly(3-hydroxybutyrate) depolymerase